MIVAHFIGPIGVREIVTFFAPFVAAVIKYVE